MLSPSFSPCPMSLSYRSRNLDAVGVQEFHQLGSPQTCRDRSGHAMKTKDTPPKTNMEPKNDGFS